MEVEVWFLPSGSSPLTRGVESLSPNKVRLPTSLTRSWHAKNRGESQMKGDCNPYACGASYNQDLDSLPSNFS